MNGSKETINDLTVHVH